MSALVPVTEADDLVAGRHRLLAVFLEGRTPQTVRAYTADLRDFTLWWNRDVTTGTALAQFIALRNGEANEVARGYRADLLSRSLSPATINRRLSALRSIVSLANEIGLIVWTLKVPGVSGESYRDTSGPGTSNIAAMLAKAKSHVSPIAAARDALLIRLLYDLALRRSEVAALTLADVNLAANRLMVIGKGRREPSPRTLPEATRRALEHWIALRGKEPGPLIINLVLDRSKRRGLTGDGIFRIVRALGIAATGHRVRPHGLRHSAITAALDANNGNARAVKQFSRHRNIETVLRYDDNRADLAGEIARSIALEE